MTLFSLRTAAHLGALLFSWTALTAAAQNAQDPEGTFNTPTYAPADAASAPANGRQASPQNRPRSSSINGANNRGERNSTAFEPGEERPTPRTVRRPAAAPSGFQKFVEAATGRQLPVFGASFFADAADSFAPVDNVPVTADYTVGAGDELLIRAWGSIDVDYRATVDRNGQVNLPKIGSFTVAGVKASDLERHLRAQIGRLYTNFNLNVTLGQLRGVKVFVVGPARLPGVYTVSSQSTMLSAVVAAGGPGPNGSMRKVLLRRGGQVVSELDMYDFLVQGDKSKDLQLAAGDVVVFQPVGARVALHGAIDTPAIYELKTAQEALGEVLRYAGGPPVLANPNKVHLERIDPKQQPAARFIEDFKLDSAGLQKPLRDGDVLTLLGISPQFSNEVTLKGHVAQPLRYPYTVGMRIRDLIPNKDALISPDFYRRKNLLVQVDEEMEDDRRDMNADDAQGTRGPSASGSSSSSSSPRRTRLEGKRPSRDDPDFVARARTPAALFDEINWDYALVERLNPEDLSTQVITFNLGKAVLAGDPLQNIELRPGDVVTVYSHLDMRVPISRQTRLVSLEGEVGAPGIYQLQPGETLQQLILRAGGFTPQAYVYGLELTREDTRKRQQENLAAAIARLEALSATQNARDMANQRETTSSQANASANSAQLARLTRIQPNGRIALELEPSIASTEALPSLVLEKGDRVVVPTRPGFISVAGAVVNSNSFLWKSDRSAGDYLDIAGLDETADDSGIFILRADGTVDHAANRRGLFGFGGIASASLNPGDAIIVPSRVDFETWGRALVRNLKDWSQIFSQFGLGAAAIQTLRRN